jgi:hypothetical protein
MPPLGSESRGLFGRRDWRINNANVAHESRLSILVPCEQGDLFSS